MLKLRPAARRATHTHRAIESGEGRMRMGEQQAAVASLWNVAFLTY